jgi:tuberous sclerosis protein 2
LTRKAILEELQNVYTGIKDMKSYRRPLGDLIWKALVKLNSYGGEQSDDEDVIWKMLGEEIVLRSSEQGEDDSEGEQLASFLEFIYGAAIDSAHDEEMRE